MLLRISCARCNLSSLWTDDADWFLETVCTGGSRCEATLVAETFAGAVITGVDPPAPRHAKTRIQKGNENHRSFERS